LKLNHCSYLIKPFYTFFEIKTSQNDIFAFSFVGNNVNILNLLTLAIPQIL
jgi:hypothetical protein